MTDIGTPAPRALTQKEVGAIRASTLRQQAKGFTHMLDSETQIALCDAITEARAQRDEARALVESVLLAMRDPMTLDDAYRGRTLLTNHYVTWKKDEARQRIAAARVRSCGVPAMSALTTSCSGRAVGTQGERP